MLVYWPQPSSVVLFIQNSGFSFRITSLCGCQSSFVAFACKTATLRPQLQVSMGSQPSSVVLCIHNSDIMTRINSLYESQTSPVVLCILNIVISTRITSLHGSQTSHVVVCMQNNEISIRITSLYVSQPSCVVFALKTASFWSELQVSMDLRPHQSFCAGKTMWLAS